MRSKGPHYDLSEIQAAVADGKFRLTKRVTSALRNHGYSDASMVAEGVFEAISPGDFLKCDEMEKLPGIMADIYRGTRWEGTEWYVKFFRRDDGSTVVDIWSLKEDGWM